jgi:pSer/pThr/pTyr-binding forkhead associated (FHA) protein
VRALPAELRAVSASEVAERLRSDRRSLPYLLYRDGEQRQIIRTLDGERLCVGRALDSDIALPWDSEVSRAHAQLERVGGVWTVLDDGLSRNGSFLNGRRIQGRQRLHDGDRIGIGRTLLVFMAAADTGSRSTEAPRDAPPPELSAAQRRVLEALCRPYREQPFAAPPSNRAIAEELVLSVETIKTHLKVLFERFGVDELPQNRKRAELARRAFESGVV